MVSTLTGQCGVDAGLQPREREGDKQACPPRSGKEKRLPSWRVTEPRPHQKRTVHRRRGAGHTMVHVGSPGLARPSGGSTTLLTHNWPPTQEPGQMRGCRPLMKARQPLCRVTPPTPPDPDPPPSRSSHTCICHQGCHGTSPHPQHLPRGSWGCGAHPSLLPLTGLLLRAASSAQRQL